MLASLISSSGLLCTRSWRSERRQGLKRKAKLLVGYNQDIKRACLTFGQLYCELLHYSLELERRCDEVIQDDQLFGLNGIHLVKYDALPSSCRTDRFFQSGRERNTLDYFQFVVGESVHDRKGSKEVTDSKVIFLSRAMGLTWDIGRFFCPTPVSRGVHFERLEKRGRWCRHRPPRLLPLPEERRAGAAVWRTAVVSTSCPQRRLSITQVK